MKIIQKTNLKNTDKNPGRDIRYIVIHYTAGFSSAPGEAEKCAARFTDSVIKTSSDFIVDDEHVVQYNPDPENISCWHCGDRRADSHGGCFFGLCKNVNSIGVELCSTNSCGKSTLPNDPCYSFTDAVLEGAAKFVGSLMDTYGIDISHVIRHYDVSGKLCPGIIGWNEESGSSDAWLRFLEECKKHSVLACRTDDCTIRGAEIIRLLEKYGIACDAQPGFAELSFSSLSYHSDDAVPGTLFFCKGAGFRPEYLRKAEQAGAFAYVAGHPFDTELPGLTVSDTDTSMGLIARAFYGFTGDGPFTIGVTGTNGKTTVTQFIAGILKEATGRQPGFLSTVGANDGLREREISLTTPESPVIYSYLHETKRNGGTHFVMECSSQSEKRKRLAGLEFDLGVFTNISDDHYSPQEHSSFEEYLNAKLDIVRRFRTAVINKDDPHCPDVMKAAGAAKQILTYSLSPDTGADVYAESVTSMGLRPVFTAVTPGWKCAITVPVPGDFNISNALAACAAGYMLGIAPEKIAAGIAGTFVPGRMFVFDQYGYAIVVDYAHNFASIRAALKAVRELYPRKHIQIVFGCAGCNGLQRRRDIVRAAAEYADRMYITNEDPATADPAEVLRDIEGYAREFGIRYTVIPDRAECIETAIDSMTKDDVLFITAKGSENFIKTGGRHVYYESDTSVVWRVLPRKDMTSVNRDDFLSWRSYDEYYNREPAWPVEEYPDSPSPMFAKIGCYVASLAIMLRQFGLVTEPSFEKFNPWILHERFRNAKLYTSDARVKTLEISKVCPCRIVDSVPYDRETLIRSLEEGYACQIIVRGKIGPHHYVVPIAVLEDDVEIIDCSWDKTRLSDLKPLWIARYLPTGESENKDRSV